MKTKTVAASQTTMSELMLPSHTNFGGFVYGGKILALIDNVAFACACRHAEKHCVTASVDAVNFHESIKVGSLVTLKASCNYVGRTSMEIGIKVLSEDLISGTVRHTNSCYVTMVAIDKDGKPTAVPSLLPESVEEKRRYEAGKSRREERLKKIRTAVA